MRWRNIFGTFFLRNIYALSSWFSQKLFNRFHPASRFINNIFVTWTSLYIYSWLFIYFTIENRASIVHKTPPDVKMWLFLCLLIFLHVIHHNPYNERRKIQDEIFFNTFSSHTHFSYFFLLRILSEFHSCGENCRYDKITVTCCE